jgi:hypothetical protein
MELQSLQRSIVSLCQAESMQLSKLKVPLLCWEIISIMHAKMIKTSTIERESECPRESFRFGDVLIALIIRCMALISFHFASCS